MTSREDRKREARGLGIWVLAVVTGLLLVYVLFTGTPTWISAMAPLITATAALSGVYLGSRLSQCQRREEETQRRQMLATLLLSELRRVDQILREMSSHRNYPKYFQQLQPRLELYLTGMYNQASADLLLFKPATVRVLSLFYTGLHLLERRMTGQTDPLIAQLDVADVAHALALLVPQLVKQLCDVEGGEILRENPFLNLRDRDLDLPPSVFRDI